jgi:hypothetical protein
MKRLAVCGLAMAALLATACPSEEDKLAELKTQCLGHCAKRDKVVEICQAFCKEQGTPACEESFCQQAKEMARECSMCCEQKGTVKGFVLGSCLSQADQSETVTPEKMWEIRKKLAEERIKGEEKEKAAKAASERLLAIQKGGWSLSDEKDEASGAVAVMAVKDASNELAGAEGPARPKLLLRCSGGAAEVYVQTVQPVKHAGGKLNGKIKLDDGAAQGWGMTVAADQDTLLFDGSVGLLKALAGAARLDFEFHAKTGAAANVPVELAGLKEILELHGKTCGVE